MHYPFATSVIKHITTMVITCQFQIEGANIDGVYAMFAVTWNGFVLAVYTPRTLWRWWHFYIIQKFASYRIYHNDPCNLTRVDNKQSFKKFPTKKKNYIRLFAHVSDWLYTIKLSAICMSGNQLSQSPNNSDWCRKQILSLAICPALLKPINTCL